MKNTIIFQLYLLFCLLSSAVFGQFYYSLENVTDPEIETASLVMKNGFVFGFTESAGQPKYHKNILLVSTDTAGNILWTKRYDAGTGVSIKLVEMIRTFDNKIVVSGEIFRDNTYPPARFVMKLNANGNLQWSKKYSSHNAYDFRGLVQLDDSSLLFSNGFGGNTAIIENVNQDGKMISALQIGQPNFTAIKGIVAGMDSHANLEIVNPFAAGGQVTLQNVDFKKRVVLKSKSYNSSNQFTSFLSANCKNGDIVCLAGRTPGGLLNGTSRIFRSNSKGKLIWAKNVQAAFDMTGSLFSNFDIVSQVYVHESNNGNIVAVVEAESTATLMLVFDANGNYLYNKYFPNEENSFDETKAGSYISATSSPYQFSSGTLIANRFSDLYTSCDSAIFVKITNGTDSAAVSATMEWSWTSFDDSDIIIHTRNYIIHKNIFCNLQPAKAHTKTDSVSFDIIPNPASDKILLKAKTDISFTLSDMNGTILITGITNRITDISRLKPGIYFIAVKTKHNILKRSFIKE